MLSLSFIVWSTISAETVSLNGIVSNKNGKPISGAIVTLMSKQLSDTTDGLGAYSIVGTVTSVATIAPQLVIPKVSLINGVLAFSLPSTSNVGIQIFDLRGNLLVNVVNMKAADGNYHFNIGTNWANGEMMLIKLAIGANVMTLRYVPLPPNLKVGLSGSAEGFSEMKLAKVTGAVDSLRVSKPGYTPTSKPVSSYTEKLNITLDTSTL
jgi:hypothetical protein